MSEIAEEVGSLLQEMVRDFDVEVYDPKIHVTVRSLTESVKNISESKADRYLKDKVAAGELIMVRVILPNRHRAYGYRKP